MHPILLVQALSPAFFSVVVWQPVLEECFFRGWLQGQLWQPAWGQQRWCGITAANGCTSLLFVAAHCWSHPPLWAVAVPDATFIDQVVSQMAELGRVNHAVNPA